MRKRKRRGMTRSGLIVRRVETTTFKDFEEFALATQRAWSDDAVKKKCEEILSSWERLALHSYKGNGLFDEIGSYVSEDGGPWRRLKIGERMRVGMKGTKLQGTASTFPPDSEVGFATVILNRCSFARGRLKKAAPDAWRAFMDAALIAQDVEALWLEYGMADVVGPGLAQKPGRSRGGRVTAAKVRSTRSPIWTKLQSCAEEIWRRNPNLSKMEVAKIIHKKHHPDERPHTIRQHINKPDGPLSTPAK